jgi:hypothetical protein
MDTNNVTREHLSDRTLSGGSLAGKPQISRNHRTKNNFYEYETLQQPPETQEFRLITLLPPRPYNPVECLLKRAKLVPFNDPNYTTYEALSYTWGDPQAEKATLNLNGTLVYVKHNLLWALKFLQKHDVPRVLWVDALCLYVNRHRTKYRRNLRLGPLFSEGLHISRINTSLFINSALASLCLFFVSVYVFLL